MQGWSEALLHGERSRNQTCILDVILSSHGDIMRIVLSLTLVAVLAACASPGIGPTDSASPTDSATPEATPTMEPIPRESLMPATPQPDSVGGGVELVGTLGADSIEGGCSYLEADDGTRYQVIYPDGWQIQASPLQLSNPAGEVVATGGETITVRGQRADDMMSICQIGPMFMASEVVVID